MKNTVFVCFLFFSLSSWVTGQKLTIERIWQGAYFPQGIYGVNSMLDGKHYTQLTKKGVEKFSYETFEPIAVVKEGRFSDYSFNEDESWLLLETETEPIYRHSKRGVYTLHNLKTKKDFLVFNGKKIMEPTLSPDGQKVAFVFDNNLYVQTIENEKIIQVTFDGKKNEIINGICDWVYEEEFSFVRAFDWNKNSESIAFIRFDESEVPVMDIDIYGTALYPSELQFKYPKAGEKNAEVSVRVFDLKNKDTKTLDLSSYTDFYVPKIQFSNQANDLVVLVSNRHQNKVDFLKVNSQTLKTKKVFTEEDKAWVQTDNFDLLFLPDNSFLWSSERDNYRHLYHYTADGNTVTLVTPGKWNVTEVYGYNPKQKRVYYQSTEMGSTQRGVYSIGLDGKKKKMLATKSGTNNAQFSKNFAYFVLNHSDAKTPNVYTLNRGKDGKQLSFLRTNAEVKKRVNQAGLGNKTFGELSLDDTTLNYYLIQPTNFDPTKQYPLLMFVYGGPGSQQVLDHWDGGNGMWFQYLAQQGYLVACVDNRGTGGKEASFKKVTYKNLGHYEIIDQIAAAKHFGQLPFVDKNRIGMFGWSFGGYMTSLALTKGADVFKAGIAVAPVTNWRFYDTVYTERFLQTPQENPEGYDQNSPINFVNLMKGNYLLIHGTADDNVHVQNSMRMAEALIQADVPFDYTVYPDKNHGIYGGNTRIHLFKKMTQFIQEKL